MALGWAEWWESLLESAMATVWVFQGRKLDSLLVLPKGTTLEMMSGREIAYLVSMLVRRLEKTTVPTMVPQ